MARGINFQSKSTIKVGTTPSKPAATPAQAVFDRLPDTAWLRQAQLVRSAKSADSAIAPLPFSAPTLWRMVKMGKFPKPRKLSARVTAWQVGDVRAWMTTQTKAQEVQA